MKLSDVKKGSILCSFKKYENFERLSEFEILEIRNSNPKYYVLRSRSDYSIFYINEKKLKRIFLFDLTKKEKRDFLLENILT